jgi:heme b synthase
MIEAIREVSAPILVLSGGEPLVRDDIFRISRFAADRGLKVALATNGTLVTEDVARRAKEAGVERASVSLDGPDPHTHDSFRQIPGSFEAALRGIAAFRAAGVPFQVNTSVANHNKDSLPRILDLAVRLGAVAFHLFLLVPVGCGLEISEEEQISPQEYEDILNWFYDASRQVPISLKATCAPHYYRILRQRAAREGVRVTRETHGMDAITRGCLAGSAVCFVSHRGDVYPCGYLPVSAGNVRIQRFAEIWRQAPVFRQMRDYDCLKGKCGVCEFRGVCGGCRARAFGETGDYLQEEPYCVYAPRSARAGTAGPPCGTNS